MWADAEREYIDVARARGDSQKEIQVALWSLNLYDFDGLSDMTRRRRGTPKRKEVISESTAT